MTDSLPCHPLTAAVLQELYWTRLTCICKQKCHSVWNHKWSCTCFHRLLLYDFFWRAANSLRGEWRSHLWSPPIIYLELRHCSCVTASRWKPDRSLPTCSQGRHRNYESWWRNDTEETAVCSGMTRLLRRRHCVHIAHLFQRLCVFIFSSSIPLGGSSLRVHCTPHLEGLCQIRRAQGCLCS